MGCKQSKAAAVAAAPPQPPRDASHASSSASGTLLKRSGTEMSVKSTRSNKSNRSARSHRSQRGPHHAAELRAGQIEQESQGTLRDLRSQAKTAIDLGPGGGSGEQSVVDQKIAYKTAQLAVAAVDTAPRSSRAAAWAACDAAWMAAGGALRDVQVTEASVHCPALAAASAPPAEAPTTAKEERVLVSAEALFGSQPYEAEEAAEGEAASEEVEVVEAKAAPAGEQEWCLSRALQESSSPLTEWLSSFYACRPSCREDAERVDEVKVAGTQQW